MEDVCLDEGEHGHQHRKTAVGPRVGGEWGALSTLIGIRIAMEIPNGYSDGWIWRSSGECRLNKYYPSC